MRAFGGVEEARGVEKGTREEATALTAAWIADLCVPLKGRMTMLRVVAGIAASIPFSNVVAAFSVRPSMLRIVCGPLRVALDVEKERSGVGRGGGCDASGQKDKLG